MKGVYALAFILGLCGPAYAQEIAIGDSIALGVKQVGHLRGGAVIGAGPDAILRMLQTYPKEDLKDQVVILSCGASNNPQQLPACLNMLDYLAGAGAHTMLLGVGIELPDSIAINDLLKAYAAVHDVPFVWGWPHIHPDNYAVLLKFMRDAECKTWRICAI